jgi:hypothetical protein
MHSRISDWLVGENCQLLVLGATANAMIEKKGYIKQLVIVVARIVLSDCYE